MPVMVTSDDPSPPFWDNVTSMGWLRVNHEEYDTQGTYGLWYELVLDIYVSSSGVGLVGTGSTMSLVAGLR